MRSPVILLLALLLCLPLGVSAGAGTTSAFTFHARNHPGSRDRQVKVYVPDGLTKPAPMVMALHGCEQTHDDVLNDWGLVAAADRYGFILVAPYITSYDGLRNRNCWGFWLDQHRHQGRGEPEDLHQIAREVEARFRIDGARRYITGLSSGAAMSVVSAVAYNEYWAAAASASGLPYGEDASAVSFLCPGSATFHPVARVADAMRAEINHPFRIPLMVLQNEHDCTVLPEAANNLRDAHLKVFSAPGHDTRGTARGTQSGCVPVNGSNDLGCQHVVYTADGRSSSRSVVETVFYRGPRGTPSGSDSDHGHYWIGGASGRNGKWSVQRGPSYPDIIWDFFSRHPREGAPNGLPRIVLNGANPLVITVAQSFTDPGASASDPEDGRLLVRANCTGVKPGRAGRYTCSYRAADSAGNTTSASREVVITATDIRCSVATSSPAGHLLQGRAVVGGWLNVLALTSGDRQDIGLSWNVWSDVSLHEGEPGRWYVAVPVGCAGQK